MNGGFEDENICTEYEKNCAPEGWISTSLFADYYFDDAPNAFEGQHFVGLVLSNGHRPVGRNFIRSRLLCGLRKGSQYRLQFRIRSAHPVFDSIGVYFSAGDFLYEKEKLRHSHPQLLLKDAGLQPSKDWQEVSFVYTASGEENFISLGDFAQRSHEFGTMPDLRRDYYFFLDDISLRPLNPNEKICATADSVKEEEYGLSVRHGMLDRLIYVHSKNPPPVPALPKTVLQRIDTLTIPDVLFATNSSTLASKAKELLDAFRKQAGNYQVDSLVVEGHTDDQGTFSWNQKLSENRAASVASYLFPWINKAVHTRGWASGKPVASNETPAGRQQNRRVEIYLYIRED